MAKIFKISGYFVDANGDCTASDIEDYLDRYRYAYTKHIEIEERDIDEWYDEIPINYVNSPKSECEKFFRGDSNV